MGTTVFPKPITYDNATTASAGLVSTEMQEFGGYKKFPNGISVGKSSVSRYHTINFSHNETTTNGYITVDSGDTANQSSNRMSFVSYTPKSTADASNTGFKEVYLMPAPTAGTTVDYYYDVYTSKNLTAGAGINISSGVVSFKTTDIPANTDLDTLKTPGFYQCPLAATAQTLSNCPSTSNFTMLVMKKDLYCEQVIFGLTNIWTRYEISTGFGTWNTFSTKDSTKLPLAGGTMTGQIKEAGASTSWHLGRDTALVNKNTYTGYDAVVSQKTTNGTWDIGTYTDDKLWFTYVKDSDYSSNTNKKSQFGLKPYGTASVMLTDAISSISRSGTTFTATRLDGSTTTFTQQDNNTTYSFSNGNPTLAWNTTSTVGTVGGVALTVKMPANPNTNTTYADFTAATSAAAGAHGLVPAPAKGKQASFLRGDATWAVPTNTTYSFSNNAPTLAWNTTSTVGTVGGVALTVKMPANPDTNTTYADFTAATSAAAGAHGLVPAPAAGKQASFLRGDKTWAVPTNTTYAAATTAAAGLVSTAAQTFAGTKVFTSNISIARLGFTQTLGTQYDLISSRFNNASTGVYSSGPVRFVGSSETTTTNNAPIALGSLSGSTLITAGENPSKFYTANTALINSEGVNIAADGSIIMYPGLTSDGAITGQYQFPAITVTANMSKAIKSISRSGVTFTATYMDGTTTTFNQQDNNTTYADFTGATSAAAGAHGLVPAPAKGDQAKFLRADKSWVVPTNTTYADFTAATSAAAGAHGLVPAPAAGAQAKFLRGDKTWATPTNTTYADFTAATSAAAGTHGLVPAPAKNKHTSFLRGDATWALPLAATVLGSANNLNEQVALSNNASNYTLLLIKEYSSGGICGTAITDLNESITINPGVSAYTVTVTFPTANSVKITNKGSSVSTIIVYGIGDRK